jgi:hypothetical protein
MASSSAIELRSEGMSIETRTPLTDTLQGQRRRGDRDQRQDRPTDETDVRRPNDEVPADRRDDRDPGRGDRDDEKQERKDRRSS